MSRSNSRKRQEEAQAGNTGFRLPWTLLAGVTLAGLTGGVLIGRSSAGDLPAEMPKPAPAAAPGREKPATTFEDPMRRTFLGQPGPWGQLRYTRIWIEPPRSFFHGHVNFEAKTRWFFPGMSPADVDAFFETVSLSAAVRTALGRAPREEADGGTWLEPGEQVILALDDAGRARIYGLLARSPRNQQQSPISVRAPLIDERIAKSDLAPEVSNLFKRLLYGEGRWRFFSDLPVLAVRLPAPADQEKLAGMLSRSVTFLVSLLVDESSDIAALANYWSVGFRTRDIEPILSSLKRHPGGYELDISHLLPVFARRRLFTYEDVFPDQPDPGHDCYWSAANFFRTKPEDRSFEGDTFKEELARAYEPVEELRLGDVVVYLDEDGVPVHASSYIADQIVFTKNGRNALHPFLFMRMDSLLELYQAAFAGQTALSVKYYRLKDIPAPTP